MNHLIKKAFIASLFAFGFTLLIPQGNAMSAEIKTKKDSLSYMFGNSLARQLKRLDFTEKDLNFELVTQAMKEVLSGGKMSLTDEELTKIGQELNAELGAKQQAKMAAQNEENTKKGNAFLAENKKKAGVTTTASGLQYEVIKKSNDPNAKRPTDSSQVRVHYEGTLIDGKVFDSSIKRNQPLEFALNGVIKGWTEGLQLMKTGDKYKFYIPAELAYGAHSPSADIPAGSTLIFEVELIDVLSNPAK